MASVLPQLYPADAPRPTNSEAEKKLWEALKRKLPAGWRAWHSLKVRTRDGAREGEGDFVLAIPGLGILVLEVKGGLVELKGGHWYQGGRKMDTAPRAQANGYVRKLMEKLEERGVTKVPFGVACVFPDCEFSAPPNTGDLEGLVLGFRELGWLDKLLPEVAARAIPQRSAPMGEGWIQALHQLWGETWVPRVNASDAAADAHSRLLSLNAEQLRVLDLAEEMPRAVVTGGAGTGKTVLAVELCRRRARAGKQVLYVCFTDALALKVDAQFAREFPGERRPRAVTARRYAVQLLQGAGVPVAQDAPRFWSEVGLRAAVEALPAEGPDLLVVDEGQDLESADWDLVLSLAGNRDAWIFHDPLQAFWSNRPLPSPVQQWPGRLKLPRQERCPDTVARFAALYHPEAGPLPSELGNVPAHELRRVVVPAGKATDRVRHEVDSLVKDGARPGDIAVITLGGQLRSELFEKEALGSRRVVHADAPDADAHVVVDTFLRFKGLERPWIVLTELEEGQHQYEARMRMALTRATAGLTVIYTEAMLARDPRLALLSPGAST